ncbi:hypothetical protein [Acetobacter sp.]|uniref:hypothetical protein n=1 Tax=Acetobacter sp. TaxID=440 RepID=UPI0025859F25|nr:hypothetical protein [Acetobacter sp.]MCC6103959.1 hypothetical protein [Acetobacter sp.]
MPPEVSATATSAASTSRSRGPFAKFMNKYGTPFTTIFFLISTVTGVALFFHWGPGAFHPMHEWLSMVLLLAFALHLLKNWTPLMNYGRRGLLYIPVLIGVLSCAYFFLQPAGKSAGGKQVAFRLAAMATKAPIGQLAPLFGTDAEGALGRLRAHQFVVTTDDETVDQVAQASNRMPNDVLMALMPGKPENSEHGRHRKG